MDILTATSLAIGILSFLLSALAQIAKTSEKTAPYAELLKQIERILSGKSISTDSLEAQLDEAVEKLTSASVRVSNILGDIQADVDRKRREAERLRTTIEELRQEYEANKSLANLTEEEASAVRQVLTREVSSLKRRSYLPDVLINFGVGAFFFIVGIFVTRLWGQ